MTDLKQLRTKVGLLQQEVAEKVGVSVNTIQNWESGRVLPKGENLKLYLNAVRVTDSAEIARIAGELATASYSGEGDDIDNAPYFLFPEDSDWITKIRECKASAEELDILGYAAYARGQGKFAAIERREIKAQPMEFAFFERYGGFHSTLKRMKDVRDRLRGLYADALEFAENNPGREFKLAALDRNMIVDKVGTFIGNASLKNDLYNRYELLKTIESLSKPFTNAKNLEVRLDRTKEINSLLLRSKSDDYLYGVPTVNPLDGYVELELPDPQAKPDISMARLTERGKALIEWVEEGRKQNK